MRRVLIANAEPSSVTFSPAELAPFAVRCEFRSVEDEDGTRREALVGGPALVETSSAFRLHAEVTSEAQRTLEENRWRYRRLAERLMSMDRAGAVAVRKEMLAGHRRKDRGGRPWTQLERLDLLYEYEARHGEEGLAVNLGNERGGIERFEISRQLKTARRERESLNI